MSTFSAHTSRRAPRAASCSRSSALSIAAPQLSFVHPRRVLRPRTARRTGPDGRSSSPPSRPPSRSRATHRERGLARLLQLRARRDRADPSSGPEGTPTGMYDEIHGVPVTSASGSATSALARGFTAARRLAQRSLLRSARRQRTAGRLRPVRAPSAAGSVSIASPSCANADLAGIQPPRRRRGRQGRHLVRGLVDAGPPGSAGRSSAAESLPTSVLRPAVPALATWNASRRRRPVGRRPRERLQVTRFAAAYRPDRLPRPPSTSPRTSTTPSSGTVTWADTSPSCRRTISSAASTSTEA